EDGIRDRNVTGVQTCALPIWHRCRDSRSYGTSTQAGRRFWIWRRRKRINRTIGLYPILASTLSIHSMATLQAFQLSWLTKIRKWMKQSITFGDIIIWMIHSPNYPNSHQFTV